MSRQRAEVRAGLDLWQWSGVTVMTWAGAAVTLPAYAMGAGKVHDPADFLCGRAQGTEAVIGDIAAAWVASGAAGTLTMSVPSTGRIRLVSSLVDFALPASSGHNLRWWGGDPAGHPIVGGVAPYVRDLPYDFLRESAFSPALYVDPAGAPLAFQVGGARWWQDPITAMRERGVVADLDDSLVPAAETLEALIIAAAGSASIRVGLDTEGRVVFAWRTGIANPGPPVWVATSFRDRIGFSGSETMASSGLVDYVRGDYPMPGVLVLEDGLDEYDMIAATTGQAVQLMGGAYGAASYGTRAGASVQWTLPGPSAGSMVHTHWLERVCPYLAPGAPVTLYPRQGEVRRRLPDGPFGATFERPAESLLYTSKPTWAAGYHGRRRGYVATTHSQEQRTSWQGESRAWMRCNLTMTMAAE